MKNNYKKLSILIPAYNEQETVIELLDKVKSVKHCLKRTLL